ncbi:MAG: TerB family tellurite resistance protein [Rhodospirillales bacterium]
MSDDLSAKPLLIIAASLAYIMRADGRIVEEEMAEFMTVFGKHVRRGDLSWDDVSGLTKEAIAYTEVNEVDDFLEEISDKLSFAQRMSILMNMYDAVLVDGRVVESERWIMQKFQNSFNIFEDLMGPLRELLILKNDTSLFTSAANPRNAADYQLKISVTKG